MGESLWPGLLSWIVLYCSDYYMTLTCARMYQSGVNTTIVFQGSYELTPQFQKDIDSLRRISPRFIALLLYTTGLLALSWYVTVSFELEPDLYLFLSGALVLLELAIHVRHFRNFYLFRLASKSEGIHGRIEYERFVSLRASALELASFAGIYLIIALVTRSEFVFGGAVMTLATAWKHRKLAQKHAKTAVTTGDSAALPT